MGTMGGALPIRADDIRSRKERGHRKSRMDQRTRERIPALPTLIANVERARRDAAELLEAARRCPPGDRVHCRWTGAAPPGDDRPHTPDLGRGAATANGETSTREEDRAFWAWAAAEVLQETGIRVEELTELSHHSLVEYKLPTTGETIPLLQIAPSKTDEERLMVVSPTLAEVLSTILRRIRDDNGAVPSSSPTTFTNAHGTRPRRCCSNTAWAWRTWPSALPLSGSCSSPP